MGADVSVVLHPDAPVPKVVISTQTKAPASHPPHPVIQHCPVICVLEAEAAKRLAGDSSATSMTSAVDLHPLDQPLLLIRNCAELDAFTKSRTYVPVLRAIYAYLGQHETATAATTNDQRGDGVFSFQQRLSSPAPVSSRPVCPIGLVFDRSLTLGSRLTTNEARAACVQYLKLFFVHLIAALEFVREPDDTAHPKWPSSPAVHMLREASTGVTAGAAALAPRLSFIYLDLRNSAMDDASARWFVAAVIMRSVRRARPFMLVSARGSAAGVTTTSSSSGNDGDDTFMNYYSPDVKADMLWASLQHVLLTGNVTLTEEGAKAVLEELLASDATREVVLRQQGIDPKAQRAQDVQKALACDRLSPQPDTQLLPQLYFVDFFRHNNNDDDENEKNASLKQSEPLPTPLPHQEGSSILIDGKRSDESSATATASPPAVPALVPPSPHHRPPKPMARTTSSTPAPASQSSGAAAARPTSQPSESSGLSQPKPKPNTCNKQLSPSQQQLQQQQPTSARGNASQASRQELQDAVAQLLPQQQFQNKQQHQMQHSPMLKPAALSPSAASPKVTKGKASQKVSRTSPHRPHQQRVVQAAKPTSLVFDPTPPPNPDSKIMNNFTPPCSFTHRPAEATKDDSPPLPQLQRPTTSSVTSPRAAVGASPPARRALEPTNTPAEVQASAQPPTLAVPIPQPLSSSLSSSVRWIDEDETSVFEPRSQHSNPASQLPSSLQKQSPQRKRKAAAPPLTKSPQQEPQRMGEQDEVEPVFIQTDTLTSPNEPDVPVPSTVVHAPADQVEATVPPQHNEELQQQPKSPRIKRTASARKVCRKRAPETGADLTASDVNERNESKQPLSGSAHWHSLTTSTPPKLSRNSRKGLPQATQQRYRNPSPSSSRRVQHAVAATTKLDDAPDTVMRSYSAHTPHTQSLRPDTRCYSPSAPPSARKLQRSGDARLPTSAWHHQYFRSPVRSDSLEMDRVHAIVDQHLRSSCVSRGRTSIGVAVAPAPPLIVSSRESRHPPELERNHVEETSITKKDEKDRFVDAVMDLQHQHTASTPAAAQEEPWLDHAYPIEHRSHPDSLSAQRVCVGLSKCGFHRNTTAAAVTSTAHPASPRSTRRRAFDIPALDPPVDQFSASASHVTPTMWETGVRNRRKSPVQASAEARRRVQSPRSGKRTIGAPIATVLSTTMAATMTPRAKAAHGEVRPRTDSQRGRTSVAEAKAAYEAATLAEARAKALMELRAQQRVSGVVKSPYGGRPPATSTAANRQMAQQQQPDDETERGALLRVEGEVRSVRDVSLSKPLNDEHYNADNGGDSPSPAPNPPNDMLTPSSLNTPVGKIAGDPPRIDAPLGARTADNNATTPLTGRVKWCLSTAEPPHIAPRPTTTSQLRKVTSQRCRRASEAAEQISGFYSNTATPRRDFRGATALASMSVRQPTREELAAVHLEQHLENDRRQSLGNYWRPSAANGVTDATNAYEKSPMCYDVSNPTMRTQRDRSNVNNNNSPSKTQRSPQQEQQPWTPAYQHSGRNTQGSRDMNNCEEGSLVPSVSPWGTGDYEGSAPRHEEGADRVSPSSSAGVAPVEVNEYGVELVHQTLRTRHRTRY